MYTCEQLEIKLNNDLECDVFNPVDAGILVDGKFDSIYNGLRHTENNFPDYLNRYINTKTKTMMYTHFDYLLLYNILKNMMDKVDEF